MSATVCGRAAPPHSGSGDLSASRAGRGMGLVLIAVLALVVDGEPRVTTGLQADATGLEDAGGAVVTRNRSAADVGDVGFRHTPLNGRGVSPIPGRGPSVPGRRARAEPVRGISGLSPRAARPRSRRP